MKKYIAVFMTVCLLITVIPVYATATYSSDTETSACAVAVQWLQNNYQRYYTLRNIEADVYRTFDTETSTKYYILLTCETMLKANSATELPYIQGMMSAVAAAESTVNITSVARAAVSTQITKKINEIEDNYIGVYTDMSVDVVVEVPNQNGAPVIFYYDGESTTLYPINVLSIDDNAMRQDGIYMAEDMLSNAGNVDVALANISSYTYNGSDARYYALDWCENVTICCRCQVECDAPYNSANWNPDYVGYSHADCANFVSQCLVDGGLPTDTTWNVGTSAWTGAYALVNYLVNNGYADSCTFSAACAGDIIKWNNYPHVGLVTYNDTVVHKYTGHTRDRKNQVFTSNDMTNFNCSYYEMDSIT